MSMSMLSYNVGESKCSKIPGEKFILEEDETLLSNSESTRFRAIVARSNYLAQDRSDIMFSVKELTRHMSNPSADS